MRPLERLEHLTASRAHPGVVVDAMMLAVVELAVELV